METSDPKRGDLLPEPPMWPENIRFLDTLVNPK